MYRISSLIVKHLNRTITEKEKEELAEWRNASPEHEEAFQGITNSKELVRELEVRLQQSQHEPYIWPHKNDQRWFLEQIYHLVAKEPAINNTQFLYCLNASIEYIIGHHNNQLTKNGDFFTYNFVLDCLSAAYGIPLLPGMPSSEAKETIKILLEQ